MKSSLKTKRGPRKVYASVRNFDLTMDPYQRKVFSNQVTKVYIINNIIKFVCDLFIIGWYL